jgi:hypothetical protein
VPGRFRWTKATNTGPAEAGFYANTGVHIGDVVLQPPARSSYLEQVKRIAPPRLLDRDAELGDLTRFCTEPGGATYVWWRAPAWAGKTALMSWFVLHPPAGVRIVSFFVIARYAGQDSKTAFIDVVLEQLATLLNQSVPTYATDATRETHLLTMLTEAAEAARDAGERLVLVVDGLDEDRGVTSGDGDQSIARLLPARPPADMRVVVAGRPNPPAATDEGHPLRDPSVVRVLATSRHATVVRDDMERELKRLLQGPAKGRDLLGVMAAAAGGLSSADLAELVGELEWQVADRLRTVAGRTFIRRTSQLGNEIFILGHEELQQRAFHYLGEDRITAYRSRIHAWVDTYRSQGWPANTPDYLLRGYFRLLQATGDLEGLLRFATDPARHAWLLAVTGADSAALREVVAAQDAHAAADDPDLVAMARLAVHRVRLTERNANLPVALPAVWASLGEPARAEATFGVLTTVEAQRDALKVFVQLGSADLAMTIVQTVADPGRRGELGASLAKVLADEGHLSKAQDVVDRIHDRLHRPGAGFHVAMTLLFAHADLEGAEREARRIADPRLQALALASLSGAHAQAGHDMRAHELVTEVEAAVESVDMPDQRQEIHARLVPAVTVIEGVAAAEDLITSRLRDRFVAEGTGHLARTLAHTDVDHALAVAWSVTEDREAVVADVCGILVDAGDWDRAELTAQSIVDDWGRARVAAKLVRAGQVNRAEALAQKLRGGPAEPVRVLVDALAETDRVNRAEALVHSLALTYADQAWAMVAWHHARLGAVSRAVAVVRLIRDASVTAHAYANMLRPLYESGHADHAAHLAEVVEHTAAALEPRQQADLLASLAYSWSVMGQPERARDLAGQAEVLARTIVPDKPGVSPLAMLASEYLRHGELDKAASLAGEADDRILGGALAQILVDKYVEAGNPRRAEEIAERHGHRRIHRDSLVRLRVAQVDAITDLVDAEQAAAKITVEPARTEALAVVARKYAEQGDANAAQRLLWSTNVASVPPKVVVRIVQALVDHELWDHAQEIAVMFHDQTEAMGPLVAVVEALAVAGRTGWVESLLTDSELDGLGTLLRVVAANDQDRADAFAERLGNPPHAMVVLADVATTREDFDRAQRIATAVDDPFFRGEAVAAVIRGLLAANLLSRAELLAHLTTDSETLAALVVADVEAGRLEQAVDVLAMITEPTDRATAVAVVVRALAASHPARAEALAADNPSEDFAVMAALVGGLAAAGMVEEAESYAWSQQDPAFRQVTVTELAIAAANAGDLERAITLIWTLENKDAAAATVASALRPEQALVVAGTIVDLKERARSLGEIAETAEPLWARRAAAEILRIAHWSDALHLLDIRAVTAVADETALMDQQQRQ